MAYGGGNPFLEKIMMAGGGNPMAGLQQMGQQNQLASMLGQQRYDQQQQMNPLLMQEQQMRMEQLQRESQQKRPVGAPIQANDGSYHQRYQMPDGRITSEPVMMGGQQMKAPPTGLTDKEIDAASYLPDDPDTQRAMVGEIRKGMPEYNGWRIRAANALKNATEEEKRAAEEKKWAMKKRELDYERNVTKQEKEQEAFELTSATKTALQKGVLDAQKTMADLDAVMTKHSDEYLTTGGRLTASAGEVMDKTGFFDDDNYFVKFNADRKVFANNAKQFFNQYKKEITGAAASEKEMQMLLDSMFNEEMGPAEFKATYAEFRRKAQLNLEEKQKALKEGISSNDRGYDKEYDPATGTFK